MMGKPLRRFEMRACSLILIATSMTLIAAAQTKPAPRLANGKPDLSGVWDHPRVGDVSKDSDGRDHPKQFYPTWLGDSVGHWEGDTLVVDTIGFNGQTWLDTEPERLTSDALHVVERFSRPDFEHINYEVTVSDPKMYTKPWTNTRVFVLMKPGQELLEYSCEENNKEITEGHVSDALTQKK